MPHASPTPDSDAELDALVERFVQQLEVDGQVDLERFCSSAPNALQSALRQRCADVLVLRRVLPTPIAAQAPHPPAAGQTLGDFRLLSEVGRGAMGVVYLARQASLQRMVALKVLYPHLSAIERSVERFRREAKSAARLRHPGICPVFAVGEERGLHWFAMEFVDGSNLAAELELVRRRRAEQRAPSPEERLAVDPSRSYEAQIAELVASVADALEYAHGEGVVHRDVKPQNILLGRDGRVLLVDFGLAKDREDQALSQTGEVAGTPFYMSPEQAEGRRDELDRRSDVFSLGVVLYELLTLRRPFEAQNSQALLLRIASATPEPPRRLNPDVPRDLETICLHALEKSPAARYATAREFAADLRRFLAHQSIVARPPSSAELVRRKLSRHRTLLGGVAAAILLTSAGAWLRSDLRARQRGEDVWTQLSQVDLDAALAANDAATLRNVVELASAAEQSDVALDVERRASARALRARVREHVAPQLERALGAIAQVRERQRVELEASTWREFTVQAADERALLLRSFDELRLAVADPQAPWGAAVEAAQLSAASPRLSVSSTRPGSNVTLRRITPAGLGPPVSLGSAPIEARAVEPGAYRIVVEAADGATAEHTRVLERLFWDYRIESRPRTDAEVASDMVFVPAGGARARRFGMRESELVEVQIDSAYWIDRTEVSNAAYKRFVEATGCPPPPTWQGVDFAAIADLPVMGIRWGEAILFAEWCGKRLPTLLEWQVAARGREGRSLPWGEERELVVAQSNVASGLASAFSDYLRLAEPVASRPESASPFGLLHTLDNVTEWCEGFTATGVQSQWLNYGYALRLGGSYVNSAQDVSLALISSSETDKYFHNTGLRCARTHAP